VRTTATARTAAAHALRARALLDVHYLRAPAFFAYFCTRRTGTAVPRSLSRACTFGTAKNAKTAGGLPRTGGYAGASYLRPAGAPRGSYACSVIVRWFEGSRMAWEAPRTTGCYTRHTHMHHLYATLHQPFPPDCVYHARGKEGRDISPLLCRHCACFRWHQRSIMGWQEEEGRRNAATWRAWRWHGD